MTVCPERCFKTPKREEVYLHDSRTVAEAEANLSRFIEDVSRRKRPHASLGYRSPTEFEERTGGDRTSRLAALSGPAGSLHA